LPPKKIFKKSQNFEFKKRGSKGQKNENFEKLFQNRKGLKKLDTKHVPHAPKNNFLKKSAF